MLINSQAKNDLPPCPQLIFKSRRRSIRFVMSGWRPLIKGYFSVALVVGAVMSSAFGVEN
jgi:hypothetical protein